MIEHIRIGVATALDVVALRAFPILVAFLVGDAATVAKISAQLLFVTTVFLGMHFSGFSSREILVAYAYLCVVSVVPYFLPRWTPKLLLAAVVFSLFLIVPGLYLHGHVICLLLGWEVALSAYSYCAEVPARRSFAEYWFFLFVNPTVAYRRRGRKVGGARVHAGGMARAVLGVVMLGVAGTVDSLRGLDGAARPLAVAALNLAGLYAAHWGLGSLQMGLFRQLGHEVPERYPQVYRARNPREFWARWNTYVGAWIRIHIFEPLVRTFQGHRRGGGLGSHWIHAFALAGSFLAVGALHDLYSSLVARHLRISMTMWFGANALVMVVWDALGARSGRRRGPVARVVAGVSMAGLVVGLAGTFPR
jgi:hypothetical protein